MRFVFLLFIFPLLLSFSFCQNETNASYPNSTATVDLLVGEEYSEFYFSPSVLKIYTPPNRTDTREIGLTATIGNINTTVHLTLSGNVTQVLKISTDEVVLGPLETRYVYATLNGSQVGYFEGNLTGFINETNFTQVMQIQAFVTGQAGRFIIHFVDEANKSLPGTYVELYMSLEFLESGNANPSGVYTTHYYLQDNYYVIVASKPTYRTKASGVKLDETDDHIWITLSGTPNLVFSPNLFSLSMLVNQTQTVTLRLENRGNGKDMWIYISSDSWWLKPSTTYVEELLPGEYVEMTVKIGPFTYPGFYEGILTADGFRDDAHAWFYVTIYQIVAGGPGYPGPPGAPSPYLIVIPTPTPAPPAPPPPVYKFPSAEIEFNRYITLYKGISKAILVKVKNTGEVPLTNVSISLEGPLYWEAHPKYYYYLGPGDTKLFLVRLLGEEVGTGEMNVLLNSKEFEVRKALYYEVILGKFDPTLLEEELRALRELLEEVDKEIYKLGSQGYPVSGAYSLLMAIRRELNKAEDSLRKKDYYSTRDWLNIASKDLDVVWKILDVIRQRGPARPSNLTILLFTLLALCLMILILYWRRKK